MNYSQAYAKTYQTQLRKAARVLQEKLGSPPHFAVIFGSGLGEDFLQKNHPQKTIPYSQIPFFPKLSIPGHRGTLHWVKGRKLSSNSVIILQGRKHFYEGAAPHDIVFPVRTLALWGVKRLILTNASGSLRPAWKIGTLVWIKDHINLTGQNPLRGPNLDMLGPRFPSLNDTYDNNFSRRIRKIARELKISLPGGVYVGITGPSYETQAELRAFKKLGGDLVGMSTVLEAIAATHAGMEVAGLAAVTNSCLHPPVPPSHQEVLEHAKKTDKTLARILRKLLD